MTLHESKIENVRRNTELVLYVIPEEHISNQLLKA